MTGGPGAYPLVQYIAAAEQYPLRQYFCRIQKEGPDRESAVMMLKNKNKYPDQTGKQAGDGEIDLRYLDRASLLALIVDQRKRIEELEAKLMKAEKRLKRRCIRLDIEKISHREDLSALLRAVLEEVEDTLETK